MDVIISNSSGLCIYEQIYTQIKNQIISGEIRAGEALPSIRMLAKQLRISVITTKRAYEELERDGYIYTLAGKGSFAAKTDTALIREENLCKIEEHMQRIIELCGVCALSKDDIISMFNTMYEGE